MAVSYLSQVTTSNPYVVPVDLNLLQRVNQYKQSQFYQNADKLGSQFSQLNNLDILNPYQQQHAKDVVNNLTTQIQNMGGLDYSDPNVSNTISGYASDVYNDKSILNGIISTKNIRSYQNNSEKIKTDPKLSKYYDPAREWYDTQYAGNPNSVQNYQKGDINAVYNGPTAPTPSLGSDWDVLTKEIQRINPNIETSFDQSGNKFFIDKTTNKEVDSSTIRRMVDGKIDGRVADQLNVHAAYNYYGLTNGKYSLDDGVKEFNSHNQNNLDRISNAITSTQNQITIEPDNQKRLDLEKQLQDLSDELPTAQKAVTQGATDFTNLWNKDTGAAFYNLYTNKLKDDISSVYSYKQTQRQLIVNQEQIANSRIDLEAMRLGAKAVRNADGSIKMQKLTKVPGQYLTGELNRDFSSQADLDKTKVTQQSLTDETQNTQNDLNKSLYDMVYQTAKVANIPGLFTDESSINTDPNANPVAHANLINKVAQLTGNSDQLERSDIDRVLQNVDKTGKFDENNNFTYNGTGNQQTYYNPKTGKPIVVLTADQISFFKKVQGAMDDASNGVDITGKISNAGAWRQFMNKYSIEQNGIENNKKLLVSAQTDVLNKSYADAKLTPDEIVEANKYFANKSAYTTNIKDYNSMQIYSGGDRYQLNATNRDFKGNTVMATAINKISNVVGNVDNLGSKVDERLNSLGNRNNFYSIILPDATKTLQEQYPNIVHTIEQSNAFQTGEKITKSSADIDPMSVVTDGNNYFIKYGSKADPNGKKGYSQISEPDLQALGVPIVPYPSLEKTVSQNGHLLHPIYIDPLATGNAYNKQNGFSGPIKIDIVNMNASGGRNADNYTPSIMYNGKQYFYKPGNSKSANGALELITNALQNNQSFTSIDQFISALDSYNQQ